MNMRPLSVGEFQPLGTPFALRLGNLARNPQRPLGDFSSFVVERLPAVLAEGEAGLPELLDRVESLAGNVSVDQIHALDGRNQDIARLDLLMPLTGLVHNAHRADQAPSSGNSLPPLPSWLGHVRERAAGFMGLVEGLSAPAGRLPSITYEDVALGNPLESDPRLFFTGDVAASEFNFLYGTLVMDRMWGRAIEKLHMARNNALFIDTYLEDAAALLKAANDMLPLFREQLPTEHFLTFRNFWAKNPLNGHDGPSGRFAAKIFHIRVLIDGDRLAEADPGFYPELAKMAPYFPPRDYGALGADIRPEFRRSSKSEFDALAHTLAEHGRPSRRTMAEIVRDQHANNATTLQHLHQVRVELDRFVSFHIHTVIKHMNQNGAVLAGTGGENDVMVYLLSRTKAHEKCARLHGQSNGRPPVKTAGFGNAEPKL